MEEKVKADRKYKDALFTYIFGNEKHKEFALSLYNAMNRSDYTNADGLEIITLGRVVYIKMKNDVAYLVQSEMFLYEQQATWNPNIPYRFLECVVGEYQKYLSEHNYNRYSRRMFALPAPHFVVLYNGMEEQPEESELHLSDMFIDGKKGDLEVTVHVYNINAGYNEGLKEGCKALYEYCWLVERIRKGMEPVENKRDSVILGKVVEEALKEMPESFLIRKMLMEDLEEVKGMIFGEYDEALDKQEQEKYVREETEAALSKGEKIGEVKGAKQKTVETVKNLLKKTPEWSDQEIADVVKDITAEEVAKLRRGEKLNA